MRVEKEGELGEAPGCEAVEAKVGRGEAVLMSQRKIEDLLLEDDS